MSAVVAAVSGREGYSLTTRHWAADTPWAAALIVHGLGEHSGRYEAVGEQLAAAGVDTTAFDLRGFGQSGGRRAYIESMDDFLGDVQDRLAERRELGLPTVLIGHSMGGLISSLYVSSDRPQPDAVVLSAPALGAEAPRWKRAMSKMLRPVLPKVSIPGGIDPEWLSHRVDVQEAYANDPLVLTDITVALGAALFAGIEAAAARLDRISVPGLVIHGSADVLVPAKYSAVLGDLDRFTRRLYPGLRHELFNENEGPEIVDEVITWVRETLVDRRSSS